MRGVPRKTGQPAQQMRGQRATDADRVCRAWWKTERTSPGSSVRMLLATILKPAALICDRISPAWPSASGLIIASVVSTGGKWNSSSRAALS